MVSDIPTIARKREKLESLHADDITIAQAMWVFELQSSTPIHLRIQRGQLSAAKVMGEWLIDVQSVHNYLNKLNKEFKKEFRRGQS